MAQYLVFPEAYAIPDYSQQLQRSLATHRSARIEPATAALSDDSMVGAVTSSSPGLSLGQGADSTASREGFGWEARLLGEGSASTFLSPGSSGVTKIAPKPSALSRDRVYAEFRQYVQQRAKAGFISLDTGLGKLTEKLEENMRAEVCSIFTFSMVFFSVSLDNSRLLCFTCIPVQLCVTSHHAAGRVKGFPDVADAVKALRPKLERETLADMDRHKDEVGGQATTLHSVELSWACFDSLGMQVVDYVELALLSRELPDRLLLYKTIVGDPQVRHWSSNESLESTVKKL